MFELKNLKFKDILNIKELKIDQQISCIIGPSGSGKTTLLRMLNKMNAPDEGEIFYNGEDLLKMDSIALRRRVVMLGQTPIIYPGTVEENLQMGLEFSGKPLASKENLKKIMEEVELGKALEEFCGSLSGGEKQRLCLARVMLMDADTYLLDEPSSALDANTEQFIIENLARFALQKQKELIMVTHSQNIEKKFPSALIIIENGRVKERKNE